MRGQVEMATGVKLNSAFGKIALSSLACICCFMESGCLESSFKLSDESRLPAYIHLPHGFTREEVSLTLNYYSNPFGPNAKFILKDKNGRVLQEVAGEDTRLDGPPATTSSSQYPIYESIMVNGVREVIEHRKMEPVFYVSDGTGI